MFKSAEYNHPGIIISTLAGLSLASKQTFLLTRESREDCVGCETELSLLARKEANNGWGPLTFQVL